MKTYRKTYKVKADKFEDEVKLRRQFMWKLVSDEHIDDNHIRVTFERGPETVNSDLGMKKCKYYENCYRQLRRKKVPVTFIIFTLLTIAAVVCYFVLKNDIVHLVMFNLSLILGLISGFLLLGFIVTICGKKKYLKHCIEWVKRYDAHPEIETPPDDLGVAEAYMQGEEN